MKSNPNISKEFDFCSIPASYPDLRVFITISFIFNRMLFNLTPSPFKTLSKICCWDKTNSSIK